MLGAALASAAVVLVVLAGFQLHTGPGEDLIGATAVALGAVAFLVATPNDDLLRSALWTLPCLILIAGVGVVNPWNLVAVTLAFDHPFIVTATIAAIGAMAVVRSSRRRWNVPIVVGCAAGLAVATALVIFVGYPIATLNVPGDYLYTAGQPPGADPRVDTYEAGFVCGRTEVPVLSSGSGFTLRQWIPVPCGDFELINDHQLKLTCAGSPRTQRTISFEPRTLTPVDRSPLDGCRAP